MSEINHAPNLDPTRADIDQLRGPALLEFGSADCGYCQRTRPLIDQALAAHPDTKYFRIEDGKGRRLGRSFGVKLWPTLIFMHDGKEVRREVRPENQEAIMRALQSILD